MSRFTFIPKTAGIVLQKNIIFTVLFCCFYFYHCLLWESFQGLRLDCLHGKLTLLNDIFFYTLKIKLSKSVLMKVLRKWPTLETFHYDGIHRWYRANNGPVRAIKNQVLRGGVEVQAQSNSFYYRRDGGVDVQCAIFLRGQAHKLLGFMGSIFLPNTLFIDFYFL